MSIYSPAEDSYLMSSVLKKELPKLLNKNSELKFLEIGIGSGIQLKTTFESGIKKENIFGVDINKKAVEHCKKIGFNCSVSNLFEEVEGKFDVIIFNPPYLPLDEREPKPSQRETTAGKEGNEIIIKFLKQAKNHLSENGKIFLITSSLSKKIDFDDLGYKARIIEKQKLFFEELVVWEVTQ